MRKKAKFTTETELAEKVIEYLQNLKWDVYQEVQIESYGYIIDIVAIQNNRIWVIECKRSFSFDLLAQAHNHLGFANYVSIAVPEGSMYSRRHNVIKLKKDILKSYGIGCLEVSKNNMYVNQFVMERVSPKLCRKISKLYKRHLCEQHKTWAKAGNSNGNRYTPFAHTVDQFKKYIKRNPGCSIAEAINSITHHYASDSTAKSSIANWLSQGIIKGVRREWGKGNRYKLYLEKDVS